jgi:hypothetical protein
MATSHSTVSSPVEPPNIDLLRRYCPGLTEYPHANVAAHIQPDEHGCWPWDAYINAQGYGFGWHEPTSYYRKVLIHRFMYETLVGPIPYGYQVHHRCHHKPCWHPLHIEAVTPKEHTARHRPVLWRPPVQLVLPWPL